MKKNFKVGTTIAITLCLIYLFTESYKSSNHSKLVSLVPTPRPSNSYAPILSINHTNLNSSTLTPSVIRNINPKALIIEKIVTAENAMAQNFYGKVVDQTGAPVDGAKATGTLMKIRGIDVGEKMETFTTLSGHDGNFQFTGLHGWQLGVVVSKEGYQIGQGTGLFEAPNKEDISTPSQRAIFHIWKLKGLEPMIHSKITGAVPCDGTAAEYNIEGGYRVHAAGDLLVQLTRSPVNIVQGKPFDWTVSISIPKGGLIQENATYPNEAPANGYQPTDTISVPANSTNWDSSLTRSYYLKLNNGQSYGRMTINIQADFQPPPTFFGADIYINPSGSRNLEFDPAKQINP